jgi:hypothetical protein
VDGRITPFNGNCACGSSSASLGKYSPAFWIHLEPIIESLAHANVSAWLATLGGDPASLLS